MQHETLNYPSNALGRFWMRIPLIFRSIVTGFTVSSIGVGVWVLMATTVPGLWSVVTMAGILIIYWRYFSGSWDPVSTQAFRRFCMRQVKLRKPVWIWGLIAACSIILLLHWGFQLTFRIHEFQPEIFKTSRYLNEFSPLAAWSMIIMASLVAGICEEIGFRGYMQAPLEKKYGSAVGISITSLVFVIVHIHQAWASGMLPAIFAISFIIGYLAYATRSLLPGIIAHVSFDIINFSYWWSDVAGTFEHQPVSVTGVDIHFITTVVVVLLSIILYSVALRKLLHYNRQPESSDS